MKIAIIDAEIVGKNKHRFPKAIADKYFDIAGDMLLEYGNGKKVTQCKNT